MAQHNRSARITKEEFAASAFPAKGRVVHNIPLHMTQAASKKRYALILAGGSGQRFWPISRDAQPKQLLKLFGEKTLLELTIERLDGFVPKENILILTNQQQEASVRALFKDLPPENIVDHLIKNHTEFQRVLSNAALAAENSGSLVTVGITPTWPCPSYGYVERGRRASIGGLDDLPVWEVARFREKPNPDLAEHFISQGNFLWNAGMFIWTIPAIFSELSRHCPVLADFVSELRGSKDFSATVAKQFGKLPKLSIDYALMERASRVLNIESTFDWDDVGNWTSVGRYLDTDSDGNQHNRALSQQDSLNNIVFTQTGQHVALIGVQDLIVVASKDGLLVATRSKAENIKKIVDGLPQALR